MSAPLPLDYLALIRVIGTHTRRPRALAYDNWTPSRESPPSKWFANFIITRNALLFPPLLPCNYVEIYTFS